MGDKDGASIIRRHTYQSAENDWSRRHGTETRGNGEAGKGDLKRDGEKVDLAKKRVIPSPRGPEHAIVQRS